MTKEECKRLAFRVEMAFMHHSFAGVTFRVTKDGFVKDWIESKISRAVWDAEYRQMKRICEFIKEQDSETQGKRLQAAMDYLYPKS